ncbi:retinoic acid receptor RXR-alpha-like [Oppia nitens]|uniref:retinoic acid receptor RXR-alpha-like n=1 Tax=Oppia nitens TaxID=1686743 RepID=UPI0023DA51B5|nr:retinoic acid receptor RXR-alpha-like [Oppia nitens]
MANEKCQVCDDISIGRNFTVYSCESCKSFFRRQIFKNKLLVCKFSEQCVINVKTRRLCKKCRLYKCLAVGMKPELVLTKDERHKRNQIIKDNRQKRSKIRQNRHSLTITSSTFYGAKGDQQLKDLIFSIKSMSSFKELCIDDQWILIKDGYFELDLIRNFKFFDIKTQTYLLPIDDKTTGLMNLNDIKLSEESDKSTEKVLELTNRFELVSERDPIIFELVNIAN